MYRYGGVPHKSHHHHHPPCPSLSHCVYILVAWPVGNLHSVCVSLCISRDPIPVHFRCWCHSCVAVTAVAAVGGWWYFCLWLYWHKAKAEAIPLFPGKIHSMSFIDRCTRPDTRECALSPSTALPCPQS